MFERLFVSGPATVEEPWFPRLAAMELEENDTEYRVRLDLSDFTPEEMEVEVTPLYLLVRARHEEPMPVNRLEGHLDELARRVDLPPGIDIEQVRAIYRQGVLQVTLPRSAAPAVRKVPITR